MTAFRRLAAPLRLASMRLGRRLSAALLVALGVATGAAMIAAVLAGSLVAQDRSVGFAVQELLERSLHAGGFAWGIALEPVFLVGLALQLPFALVAALVGGALTGIADDLGERRSPPRPRLAASADLPFPHAAERRAPAVIALGRAERAPPLPA